MAWKKANPDLITILEKSLSDFQCDRKFMFGSPTFFVRNNMFAGVHQDTIIMRLSEKDREELFKLYDEVSLFEPMEGRPMKEYVALPEEICIQAEILREWLGRSFTYVSSLPPKEPRRTGKRKKIVEYYAGYL
ncbi:MAG: TfoX/Sxy family protein [Dehalococcoidia bacterium]|nr:TfoX/Sxy family protein [Dehalococcoidia bacterium]